MLVLSRIRLPGATPVLAAGAGRHLARRLAVRLGRQSADFAALIPCATGAMSAAIGICAPAAAMALLAETGL